MTGYFHFHLTACSRSSAAGNFLKISTRYASERRHAAMKHEFQPNTTTCNLTMYLPNKQFEKHTAERKPVGTRVVCFTLL